MSEAKQIRELRAESGTLYFATEYPISALDCVEELTDFDFLIGLMAIRSRDYKYLFTNHRPLNRYRIVDSGIFEDPKNPPTTIELCDVAYQLEADEVVMTDYIGECQKTIDACEEFMEVSRDFPFKIMGVPQGQTLEEWFDCYNYFVKHPRVDVIGLTYFKHPPSLEEVGMTNFRIQNGPEAARLALLHLLAGSFYEFRYSGGEVRSHLYNKIQKPIHILGLGTCHALPYYRQLPFVRSIDTSFPIQLAMEGRALRLDSIKSKFKVNFIADVIRAEKALIAINLQRFHQLCHGTADPRLWEVIDRCIL